MFISRLVFGSDCKLPKSPQERPQFHSFVIKDRNPLSGHCKNQRFLEKPNDSMRRAHALIIKYLRSLKVEMPFATASRPGDSPKKNVERHRGNRFFWFLDLSDAYRAVRIERLAQVLCQVDSRLEGRVCEAEDFLRQFCFSQRGGLPAGAPASPDLFNLYCASLIDVHIGELCEGEGLTYTRYLDDMTISGQKTVSRLVRKRIREIVDEAHFRVNHKKCFLCDLRKSTAIINGVGLDLKGRVFVPPFYVRYFRGLVHRARRGDWELLPRIAGAFSVLKSVIDQKQMTEIERKAFREYQLLRKKVRRSNRKLKRSSP